MTDNLKFSKETLNGDLIYRLDSGTKYLPSLYVKHNKNWDSWMVFDYLNHIAITNRIFKTQKDCVEYIATYDKLSEDALDALHSEIDEPTLATVTKSIDFAQPFALAQVMNKDLVNIVQSQQSEIASKYNKDAEKIELVYTFFDGLLSLFFIKNSDNHGDISFFIFNNGSVSDYPAWKTVSVAISLFKKLIDYNKEQNKQNQLEQWRDSFVGKALIDTNGVGLSFSKHIENSNLVLLQKVQVVEVDGCMVADAKLPLTPLFICEITDSDRGILLELRSVKTHINTMNETFLIEQYAE